MPDQITETTNTGWLARIKSALTGIIIGPLIIILSIWLLWSNEIRSVNVSNGLEEGAKAVVSLTSPEARPESEGKLIHTSGVLDTTALLRDDIFGVEQKALRLDRKVEMYQWTEKKSSSSNDNLGGSQTTTTTYSYEKKWTDAKVNSSNFHTPTDHTNPEEWKYTSSTIFATDAKIGNIAVGQTFLGQLKAETTFTTFSPSFSLSGTKVENTSIYIGVDSAIPQVGDIRIRYSYTPVGTMSIIGKLMNQAVIPYTTKTNTTIALITPGTVEASSMFATSQANNTLTTWMLRGAGMILMFAGFSVFFQIISILTKFLPILSVMVEWGLGLVSFCLTLLLGGTIIAIAWFAARPMISAIVAVVVAGVIWGVYQMKKGTTVKVEESGVSLSGV
ncbi:MAG: TMEM43 family protein [Candidatus Gracilibacteria bacterium]|nr:TMEM43 family protein [Candidatus Gracilibacteria bacterium]